MDLKFSFGNSSKPSQSSHDTSHDHAEHSAGAAGGIPLPFAGASSGTPLSSSSVLELRVSLGDGELVCEALSGDGVGYARAAIGAEDRPLAAAVRSVLARAGAELPEPLRGSVTAVVLDLGGREAEALEGLGLTVSLASSQLSTVDEALQARTGLAAGTPITTAG